MPVTRSMTRRRSTRLSTKSKSKAKKPTRNTSRSTKKSVKSSRKSTKNNESMELSELKGSTATEYAVGDIVWAKYQNYPWWPGRIIGPASGKNIKRGKLVIHWFGDFDGREDPCSRTSIIPFTTKYAAVIQKSVTRADGAIFKSSLQQARAALTELREERGYTGELTPEPPITAVTTTVSTRRRSSRLNDLNTSTSTVTKSNRGNSTVNTRSRKRNAAEASETDDSNNSGSEVCEMPEETTTALSYILQTHSAEDLSPFVYHMYHACTAKLSNQEALEVTAAAYGITTSNAEYHMECYTNDS